MKTFLIFVSEVRYMVSGSPRQIVLTGVLASMFVHQMWSGTTTGYALLLAAAFALLLGIQAYRGTRFRLHQQAEREAALNIEPQGEEPNVHLEKAA